MRPLEDLYDDNQIRFGNSYILVKVYVPFLKIVICKQNIDSKTEPVS